MSRTLEQKTNMEGFPKAGELIEIQPMAELTLQERRIFNLLIEHAGPRIADDEWHEIALQKLRNPKDKATQRIVDAIDNLMSVKVKIPCKDPNGLDAILTTVLISENLQTIDENDRRAILRYKFTETMRRIVSDSRYWGRLKAHVMFAFSSKYALTLYEAVCLRANLKIDEQIFPPDEFRRLLDVPNGKYPRYPQFKQSVIAPMLLEVNSLSDFNAEIEVLREGGMQRGKIKGFRLRWERKSKEEWREVLDELGRSKTGRKARISGTVEHVTFNVSA